jgi:hypothetical protein
MQLSLPATAVKSRCTWKLLIPSPINLQPRLNSLNCREGIIHQRDLTTRYQREKGYFGPHAGWEGSGRTSKVPFLS